MGSKYCVWVLVLPSDQIPFNLYAFHRNCIFYVWLAIKKYDGVGCCWHLEETIMKISFIFRSGGLQFSRWTQFFWMNTYFMLLSFPLDITNSCLPCYYNTFFSSFHRRIRSNVFVYFSVFIWIRQCDKVVISERKGKLKTMLSNNPNGYWRSITHVLVFLENNSSRTLHVRFIFTSRNFNARAVFFYFTFY